MAQHAQVPVSPGRVSWILRGDGGDSVASSREEESHIAPQSHRPSDSTAIDRQSKEGTQRRLSSETTPSQMVLMCRCSRWFYII